MEPDRRASEYLRKRLRATPSVALILGSGLGELAERVEDPVVVSYADIPGFAPSTVVGHAGRLVAGRLEGVEVLAFQGRYHAYEGHDPAELATPVRTARSLGARTLIVTCAAGGVNRAYGPGTLMLLSDHLNLMARNPLVGSVREGETRFPDMTDPYDPGLRRLAMAVAGAEGIGVTEGVYAAVLGPSYETPAEIRMLATLGADAVGMSTVPEVIAARAGGMRVLGIALITNAAAGITGAPLDHEEVIAAGVEAAERFQRLVRGVLREV
ncbi:MAG: purine-nucleoside phosphorylase [Gemmatimonadota bacterium]